MKIFDQPPEGSELHYNGEDGVVEVWQSGVCVGRLLSGSVPAPSFEDATAIRIDMYPDDENCSND